MSTVTVTWKAFGDQPERNRFVSSVHIEAPAFADPLDLCNKIFRDTNLYEGELWDVIQPSLSPTRTHTALSVGDEIGIDGTTFRCEGMGWSQI